MTHNEQDVENYHAGDDLLLEVTVTRGDGTQDLTGASATYEIFRRIDGTKEVEVSKDTTGGGVQIVDAVNGRLDVDIDGSDTENMEGVYQHRLRVTNSSGETATVFTGRFVVHP